MDIALFLQMLMPGAERPLIQLTIMVTGATAIFLSQSPKLSHRKWACIVGAAFQPLWIVETYLADMPGMLVLSVLYLIAWLRGVNTYWLNPRNSRDI